MRRAGYSGYRTRRRSLVPEALLREPVCRESGTSGGVESGTSGAPNVALKKSKAKKTSHGGSDGGDTEGRGGGTRAAVHARCVCGVEVPSQIELHTHTTPQTARATDELLPPTATPTPRDYENRRGRTDTTTTIARFETLEERNAWLREREVCNLQDELRDKEKLLAKWVRDDDGSDQHAHWIQKARRRCSYLRGKLRKLQNGACNPYD
jgi:hypothetical protein